MLISTGKHGSPKIETQRIQMLTPRDAGVLYNLVFASTLPLPYYCPVGQPCFWFSHKLELFPIATCTSGICPVCRECWYPHSSCDLLQLILVISSSIKLSLLTKEALTIPSAHIFFTAFISIDIFSCFCIYFLSSY